jgi:hypothetical protein
MRVSLPLLMDVRGQPLCPKAANDQFTPTTIFLKYLSVGSSDPGYRGEAYQHLDLEVKGHFRIGKV